MEEKKRFKKDTKKTASTKNKALSVLLLGQWKKLNIVKIERIEIGNDIGWRVTHRK
ncbi:MAG: hypothetical protein ACYSWZ_11095 [Planctomycetota bacterium]|jgi:hypothetical protein